MKNNIKSLRKAKGLSMQALADLVGTSQQQIDRLEKGQRKITVEWIEKLCPALSCAPSDLVTFEVANKSTSKTKTKTATAKIIGAIETGFSNMIRKFDLDEQYEISFRGDSSKEFFGLLVEGGAYKKYPEGSELIFRGLSSAAKLQGAAEEDGAFLGVAKNKNHQFEIDGKTITAELVKSIRSE